MDGPVVCCLNKYIIKSTYSTDSTKARNVNFHQNVDWVGEIYNVRELWIRSANPKYHDSIFCGFESVIYILRIESFLLGFKNFEQKNYLIPIDSHIHN